jgi:hypothetical protein
MIIQMPFDAAAYGPQVGGILALDSSGERLMPLVIRECSSPEARRVLAKATARDLFADAAHPEAAMSGLWLYFSCFDEAHRAAQDLPSAEGGYWHAIVHRQEPDAGNSAYWFRRVRSHAIFQRLAGFAAGLGFGGPEDWDPFAFIDYCEQARRKPGSGQERIALEIQRREWQLLFDYCARKRAS